MPVHSSLPTGIPRYAGAVLACCGFVLTGLMPRPAAAANEVMVDRCSNEVSIVSWGAVPGSNNAILLKRGANGESPWTPAFRVTTSDGGHIRWWCHSTTGNAFDPGTWRITNISAGYGCDLYADGSTTNCHPNGDLKVGSSAWNGWTPERSRCGNRSGRIRARLSRDRKLLIECLSP